MSTVPARSVFGSVDALTAELVHQTVQAAAAAIAARGRFTMALTGGSAATTLYPVLAQASLPWDRVHILFGDERCVPGDHDDSNHALARRTLLARAAIPAAHVHRVRGEDDPAAAAIAYERTLLDVTDGTGALDVVHVGMGPDGHVCSLFPGHPLLREEVALVAALTDSPKPPAARVTLTLQALARARQLWFLVTGGTKAGAAHDAILDPASTLPAALAARRGARVRWLLDGDAARFLR
ncbi:MAG: 6-phosphogluconolactonase [Deltaproteobacteria bacterium]|nr:6-phosphogluconolactonase [Deltaproteobacteria bacterium]